MTSIKKDATYLYNNCKICSIHFEESMFMNNLKNRLKPDAIPTVFNIPNPPPSVTPKRKPPRKRSLLFPVRSAKKQKLDEVESGPLSDISNSLDTSQSGKDPKLMSSKVTESPRKRNLQFPVRSSSKQKLDEVESGPLSDISDSLDNSQDGKDPDLMPSKVIESPTKARFRKLSWKWKARAQRLMKQGSCRCSTKKSVGYLSSSLHPSVLKFMKMFSGTHYRYNEEIKSFALSLYFLSRRAYDLLRKYLPLPSPRLLQHITSRIPIQPGINDWIVKVLQLKTNDMSDKEKNCIICLDEMAIKKHLYYNINKDTVVGFTDADDEKDPGMASSALVVMVRGIASNWKQALAYYFVKDNCTANQVMSIISDAFQALTNIGLKVHGLVTDMGSNFLQMTRQLGVTSEKPFFEIHGEQLFYIFDPPHLIKSIRNNLMQHDFVFSGKRASWKDIEEMYKIDKTLSFRMAPKLTDRHIYLNNFSKMRVKYATQVLSHSTAAAIHTNVSLGKMLPQAIGTAELCEKFDNLFDCSNSSSLNCTKLYRQAFTKDSPHQQLLEDMLSFIGTLTVLNKHGKDVTNSIKCLHGWQVSIRALLALWKRLHFEHGFKFMFTRRLNQDALENFFCSLRQGSGNNDNPTPVQFVSAFKKVSLDFKTVNTLSSNCSSDSDVFITKLNELSHAVSFQASEGQSCRNSLKVQAHDYRELSIPEKNSLTYVAGYIMKKCLEKHCCETCKQYGYHQTQLNDSQLLFTYFKAYETTKTSTSDFGALCVPHESFIMFITSLNDIFQSNFDSLKAAPCIGKTLLEKCHDIHFEHPCPDFPREHAVKLFVRMMMYHSLKQINRSLKTLKKDTQRQTKNKLNKLQHK